MNRGANLVAALVAGTLACLLALRLPGSGLAAGFWTGWIFAVGLSVGSLVLLMIHEFTGGAWGLTLGPALRSCTAALPALLLFALPLGAIVPSLYPWASPVQGQISMPYWTRQAFDARGALVLALWTTLALLMRTSQRARRRVTAACGLSIYLFTVTLAADDWVASLVPGWSSSVVGVFAGTSQVLSALAFAACIALQRDTGAPPARVRADIAALLLTTVLFWIYIFFMQYLIIWGEDLPAETIWYRLRSGPVWSAVGTLLVALNFAFPLGCLVFRRIKCSRFGLFLVAATVFCGQILNLAWLLLPSLAPTGAALSVECAGALLVCVLWRYLFSTDMRGPYRVWS